MRQEAIELIVALKGHTLPKGAENAYNRFCKAIAEEEKQDVEQSSTESKETFDQPVATLWQHGETGRTRITMPGDITDCDARWFKAADLYTAPLNPLDSIKSSNTLDAQPQREWVGLTDEDLSVCDEDGVTLARYWEAKLKEKNT
jgi:hypothetical protein